MSTFASASDLSDYLGRQLSAEEEIRAQFLLEMATAVIQGYCGQHFFSVLGDTVTLEPVSESMVVLPERPVTAVSSVVVEGVTVDPSTYRFTTMGKLTRPRGSWFRNWHGFPDARPVTVTYNHGYATIPGDLRAVCVSIAARARSNPESHRQESQTAGPYTKAVTFAESGGGVTGGLTLSTAEKTVLDRYRMP